MSKTSIGLLILVGMLITSGSLLAGETTVTGEMFADWRMILNDQVLTACSRLSPSAWSRIRNGSC